MTMANPAEYPEKAYTRIHFFDPTKWTKDVTTVDGLRVRTYTSTAPGQSFEISVPGEATPQVHTGAPTGTKLVCSGGYVEVEKP